MAYLIFTRNGPADPQPVGSAAIVLGRAPDCDIQVKDNQLSRRHCRFVPQGDKVLVEDLASANGTRLNGVKLEQATPLNPGDRVQLGDAEVVFSADGKLPEGASSGGHAPEGVHLALRAKPDGVTIPEFIPLGGDAYKVGRKAANDIVLKATVVSGQHCELVKEGGRYRIRDLGSTNGVKINGKKVPDAVLEPGDVIAFDTISYAFVDPSAGPAGATGAARLIAEKGKLSGEIALSGVISFGRKPGNTHVIKGDKEISGNHAKIEQIAGGQWVIVDLGSTNGTKLDGKALEANKPMPLLNGSVIRLGSTLLRVVNPDAPDAPKRSRSRSSIRKKPAAAAVESSGTQVAESGLGDELELDLDDDGDTVRTTKAEVDDALAGSPEDAAEALEHEMEDFLSSGTKRKRSPVWRVAEVGVVLAAVGAVVFAVMTSRSVKPPVDSGDRVIPPPSDSLITTNWSFEDEEGESALGEPAGWEFVFPSRDDTAFFGEGKTGTRSLEIQRGNTDYSITSVFYEDAVALGDPAQKVTVGAQVMRTGPGGGAGLVVEFYAGDDGTEFLASVLSPAVNGASAYQDISITAEPPAGATQARVGLYVAGEKGRFAFDDVTATLEPGPASPLGTVTVRDATGTLEWQLYPNGSFALLRRGEDRPEPVLTDAQITFSARRDRVWGYGMLADLAVERSVDADGGRMQITLLNPLASSSGSTLATNAASITLGFADGQPTVKASISGGGITGVGLFTRVRDVSRERPAARFDSDELTFYRVVDGIGGIRSKADAGRLVLPLEDGFVAFANHDTSPDSRTGRPVPKPLAVRFETERLDGLVDVMSAGSSLDLDVVLNPHADALRELAEDRQRAEQARQVGAALDAILRSLELSVHDHGAIVEASESVRALVAGQRYKIDELTEDMESLRHNFSRDRFLRMQEQYRKLLESIGKQSLMEVHGEMLERYARAEQADSPELEYGRYFREIRDLIKELDNVEGMFDGWIAGNRANVDAATLSRQEDEARTLLVRALDFGHPDYPREGMAIETYREVLRQYPLSRPATIARTRLVELAQELLELADSQAREYPGMAESNRKLARSIAGSVLANSWMDGETERPIWDEGLGTWSPDRAADFVAHFYQVDDDSDDDAPWKTAWPDHAEQWWEWSEDRWRRAERDARQAAERLQQ